MKIRWYSFSFSFWFNFYSYLKMINDIFLLGSTGSIGNTVLKVIRKNKTKFRVKLLSTNKNIDKIYKQALEFDVKKIVIFDKKLKNKHIDKFKKKI